MAQRGRAAVAKVVIPAVLFFLALLTRMIPPLRGGGWLINDNYDPSVYYAAAVGLFEGRIPYRDFLLLHPPGLILALQPFAALGAVVGDPAANVAARVSFMVIGAVIVVLVYRTLLPRGGVLPAVLAAGCYVSYYPAMYTERTTRLEGLAGLLVMIGLAVLVPAVTKRGGLSWQRAAVVGALFGLGFTVKIWGAVLVAVLVIWLALAESVRAALAAAAGAALAAAVVLVPFQALAPQMWAMVVLDQLGRARSPIEAMDRVTDIVGLGQFDAAGVPMVAAWLLLIGCLTLIGFACADRLGRLYVALLLSALTTLLAGPTWFAHYPAFAAVPLVLSLGTGASVLARRLRPVGRKVAIGVVVVAVGLAAGAQVATIDGSHFPARYVSQALSGRPGCITTDNPVSLILTNTLRRNLHRGCPLVVDLSGYIFDLTRDQDTDSTPAQNPAFQRELVRYLGSGDTTVIMRLWPASFSRASRQTVETWPLLGGFRDHAIRAPHGITAR